MSLLNKHLTSLLVAGAVLLALLAMNLLSTPNVLGRAEPGVQGLIATSSFQAVTAATPELLFATSSCVTRVIGNQGGEIKLTFSDFRGDRPTGVNGSPQAASTTEVYDAEVFGCGAVWVYPYNTGTLTITEYR